MTNEPLHFRAKFMQHTFLGLLSLAIFWDLSGNTYVELMGLAGTLFFFTMFETVSAFMGVVLTFQDERPVFLREQAKKMYGVLPYYLTKTLLEVPVFLICPMIISIITYFGVGTTITAH